MSGSRSTTSSRRSETETRSTVVLRLTFTGAVSADSVIQHLLETFNDDGSLVEAVAEPLASVASEHATEQ